MMNCDLCRLLLFLLNLFVYIFIFYIYYLLYVISDNPFSFLNMYCDILQYIILKFHLYNLVTSKPEKGWFGQLEYCLLIYYVVSAFQ